MLTSKNLQGYCTFMVDSGVAINMIKTKFLKNSPIDLIDKLILRGITKNFVETERVVTFSIAGKIMKFYVVQDEVPIPSDDILGSEFKKIFKNNDAILDCGRETLIIEDMLISFFNEKGITIPARMVLSISYNITNPEKAEGYIPRCEPIKGFGEALVTNSQDKGYLKVYNVTDHTIIVKPMHLKNYYPVNSITPCHFSKPNGV